MPRTVISLGRGGRWLHGRDLSSHGSVATAPRGGLVVREVREVDVLARLQARTERIHHANLRRRGKEGGKVGMREGRELDRENEGGAEKCNVVFLLRNAACFIT